MLPVPFWVLRELHSDRQCPPPLFVALKFLDPGLSQLFWRILQSAHMLGRAPLGQQVWGLLRGAGIQMERGILGELREEQPEG